MARQVRSEATRRKILDAAIDVFNEVGYAAADRGTIIERTGMTKGAFYHHFDSMESLASAIIEEGAKLLLDVLGAPSDSFSPALENMVHRSFVVADLFASNRVARTAEQLTLAFGKFNDTRARVYANWVQEMAAEVSRAITEGDLREGLDPNTVSESIIGATFGTRILSQSTQSGNDLVGRLTRMWELLFPAIVTDTSLSYYREYLAREALRHLNHDSAP
ncbi:ScbR family autoregulator-binding transcription factor [Candidatus Mycobacterium methanotrophicum]|uniref:TetR/AcrR family transcriptional regulator n=1 Tax=Candidatus Mycobacterium methanotrophicum TaxID=2943498 RepID=A0ABY4QNF2_9MYCO|nr:ScbR family autoregulator-binding transcription factor [Candidatus Mycobacterium methanotrophicum]UQX12161.1 TetR/AcrR family transcriptional regulator [Candidatus Mycobacterium methanotrophicum]